MTLVGDPFRLPLINFIPKTTGDRSNMFAKMQAGTCLVPIDSVESENIKKNTTPLGILFLLWSLITKRHPLKDHLLKIEPNGSKFRKKIEI